MTKPEPLKGKVRYLEYSKQDIKCHEHVLTEDIKSAVEWLKQQDEIAFEEYANGIHTEGQLLVILRLNRNKAFEDVIEKMEKQPIIKISVKKADTLRLGLKDINGKLLPKTGIVIKKVRHCSELTKEYIVPESNNYYSFLDKQINGLDLDEFVSIGKKL